MNALYHQVFPGRLLQGLLSVLADGSTNSCGKIMTLQGRNKKRAPLNANGTRLVFEVLDHLSMLHT
jgi:hypothetical protein